METQSHANHAKYVPLFHFILLPGLFLTMIGSFVNLYESVGDHQRLYSASLVAVLSVGCVLAALFARIFALRAQDRAIRAEERLRHFMLTGKPLDPRLTLRQIVALRFAPDSEFVALARKAADENLPTKTIKQAIKAWKPDTDRL